MKISLTRFTLFAALIGLLAVLAACSTTPDTLRITLVAEDIMWNTHEIHVKVNQPVELTIRNDGALDHDIQIEDLGVDLLLSPGDVEIVNFTVDHATTIHYICSIPGHEEAGMVGDIIVSE
jgi:uncharacterized cupredoxin-like copper-binding protein